MHDYQQQFLFLAKSPVFTWNKQQSFNYWIYLCFCAFICCLCPVVSLFLLFIFDRHVLNMWKIRWTWGLLFINVIHSTEHFLCLHEMPLPLRYCSAWDKERCLRKHCLAGCVTVTGASPATFTDEREKKKETWTEVLEKCQSRLPN